MYIYIYIYIYIYPSLSVSLSLCLCLCLCLSLSSNLNIFTKKPTKTHYTDTLAIKLKCLRKKSAWYSSHKEFLSQFIQDKLVLKDLKLSLEPKIGNCGQKFIDNCYSNLKDFSLILMKHIIRYCEKTEQKIQTSITDIEAILKQQLKKHDYAKIQNVIKVKGTATQ